LIASLQLQFSNRHSLACTGSNHTWGGGILQGGDEAVADLTVDEAIREKREAIVRIAASHGAIQVRLIGSVARGDPALTATSICGKPRPSVSIRGHPTRQV
jgi:hypothetical protein